VKTSPRCRACESESCVPHNWELVVYTFDLLSRNTTHSMPNEKISGASVVAILGILIALATLVANWLAVPGFPLHPFGTQERQRTSTFANENTDVTVTSGQGVVSTPPAKVAQPAPSGRISSSKESSDEVRVDEEDKLLPNVVAAAGDALNALRSPLYVVRGHLRSAESQPNEALQGLITTTFTLDVTLLDAQRGVHESFTVTSRGIGFTTESSTLQARERLRSELLKHLQREHP